MARNNYNPPANITGQMLPFVALVSIQLGQAVRVDAATGKATLQDNHAASPEPCIGIAANNAQAGEIVFVQYAGTMIIPTDATCTPGHFVGSKAATSADSFMNDLGDPATYQISATVPAAIAGIAMSQTGNQLTMLVAPQFFAQAPGTVTPPPTIPTFVDNETPTTFTTNAEFVLANTPNPLSSLLVFINSEAVPKPGCDRLLVQGVDYHLGGTGNKHIIYDVTPTATNTIKAFYRM